MKYLIIAYIAAIAGCAHSQSTSAKPKASSFTDEMTFAVTASNCRPTQNQPDNSNLVSLICISQNGLHVSGILIDQGDWNLIVTEANHAANVCTETGCPIPK